ncbi:hypothetical protein LXL04_032853 [Taraxacum kok-saghyz]
MTCIWFKPGEQKCESATYLKCRKPTCKTNTARIKPPTIPLSNLQQSERDKLVSVPEAVATTEICTSEAFPVTMDGDLYIGRVSVAMELRPYAYKVFVKVPQ